MAAATTTTSAAAAQLPQQQQYATSPRELDNDGIVGGALKLLHTALHQFAGKMLTRYLGEGWVSAVLDRLRSAQPMAGVASTTFGQVAKEIADTQQQTMNGAATAVVEKELDLRDLLLCTTRMWDIFRTVLKPDVRSMCFELTGVRNRWAHQEEFTVEDTYRSLDTIERVLSAIGAAAEMQAVRLDRQGYAVFMAERLVQQGIAALPVREQSTRPDWCGPRASAARPHPHAVAPSPSPAPAAASISTPAFAPTAPSPSSTAAAPRGVQLSAAQVEQEFGMDWEL